MQPASDDLDTLGDDCYKCTICTCCVVLLCVCEACTVHLCGCGLAMSEPRPVCVLCNLPV